MPTRANSHKETSSRSENAEKRMMAFEVGNNFQRAAEKAANSSSMICSHAGIRNKDFEALNTFTIEGQVDKNINVEGEGIPTNGLSLMPNECSPTYLDQKQCNTQRQKKWPSIGPGADGR